MGNTSKHKINRTITSKLPSHPKRSCGLHEGLALYECNIINEVLYRHDKALIEFEHIIDEAKKELKKNGINFVSESSFHNPPSIKDALECASFFLDFKVTSVSDIRNIFGDTTIEQIDNKLGITTFKDNLNPRSSDSVLLFNIALIYCTNSIKSTNKDTSIPFFILKEKYQSLTDIQYNNDRSAFLFDVYDELFNFGISNSPFSSNFVSLYRAYEYFIIPSNSLVQRIIDARKEYSRNNKKYNDDYVRNLKEHEKKIKEAQRNLLFYISNNIIYWLNIQDDELLNYEYQREKQGTLELLTDIMNEFSANRPPRSLSREYFVTALLHMNSNESINYFIHAVNSLFTIKDVYMLKEFYKIIFHVLGKHHLPTEDVNIEDIFNHIYTNSISEKSILSFADFIYGISEISDEEYLIIDTLLYSTTNNPEEYQKIHDMLLAFNPTT